VTAAEVLAAIRRHSGKYPVVHEMVLTDKERGRREPRKRRIDGLLIAAGGKRTAIEIKVSRADYARESDAKRRAWMAVTSRFVYACPAGLLQPSEMPPGCGLWWIHEDGRLTVERKCSVNKDPLPVPDQLFAALAYRLEKPR
jgi:hypothetical protein